MKPLYQRTAPKLAGMGCRGPRSSVQGGGRLARPWARVAARRVAVLRGDATGVKLDADPAYRLLVNVGSAPVVPADPLGSGQAHRPLLSPGRGGAAVVLRGRESWPHGEGRQRTSSTLGWREVAGEHQRVALGPRRGAAAGTSRPVQAARVGIARCQAQVPRSVEPGLRSRDVVGRVVAGEPEPGVKAPCLGSCPQGQSEPARTALSGSGRACRPSS
jgi:hypothetical protein